MRLMGFTCPACNTLFALEDDGEVETVESLLRGRYPCPLCSRDDVKATLVTVGFREKVSLGSLEMWNYFNGLGRISERASPEKVEALLLNHRIIDVRVLSTYNPGRCVVEHLRLDNGKTLHLAASGEGATVYKVTEEENARESSELRDRTGQEGTEEHTVGCEGGPRSLVADH